MPPSGRIGGVASKIRWDSDHCRKGRTDAYPIGRTINNTILVILYLYCLFKKSINNEQRNNYTVGQPVRRVLGRLIGTILDSANCTTACGWFTGIRSLVKLINIGFEYRTASILF